jgi:purine nucleosidase
METRSFLLDMDVGIDDAVAIIFLAMQSNVEIVALGSVHGNVDSTNAALNALRTFEICGKYNIPVAIGAAEPLAQPVEIASHVHGDDGLGNTYLPLPQGRPTGEHAVDQILRLSHERPGELDLLAVGPLTNIGLALQRDPLVLTRFRSVVIMGGAGVEQPPDEELFGYDANIDHDPHAAELFFAAPGNKVSVGVNVTNRTVLTGAALEAVRQSTTAHGRFAWDILQFYLDVYEQRLGYRGCALHDSLAAGVALDQAAVVLDYVDAPAEVIQTARGKRGVVARSPRFPDRPPTRMITAVDVPKFIEWQVQALV